MKTQDRTIKKYMARPQNEAGNTVSDYEDRTIRDVKIGDVVQLNLDVDNNYKVSVLDIGKNGFVDQLGYYHTFKEVEIIGFKLKQPEKQEIEIAEELFPVTGLVNGMSIVENRELIIELQKVVNQLLEK